jgi:hypothetical protein
MNRHRGCLNSFARQFDGGAAIDAPPCAHAPFRYPPPAYARVEQAAGRVRFGRRGILRLYLSISSTDRSVGYVTSRAMSSNRAA